MERARRVQRQGPLVAWQPFSARSPFYWIDPQSDQIQSGFRIPSDQCCFESQYQKSFRLMTSSELDRVLLFSWCWKPWLVENNRNNLPINRTEKKVYLICSLLWLLWPLFLFRSGPYVHQQFFVETISSFEVAWLIRENFRRCKIRLSHFFCSCNKSVTLGKPTFDLIDSMSMVHFGKDFRTNLTFLLLDFFL